jgi:hypothetical protein
MWVDYDVPKWFLTSKNFYRSPFSKWPPQYRTNSTLFDFNVLNWFPTSLSPIWRGFAPGFVNYKKGCTRLAVASDKVYQLLAHGRWFSPDTPASSNTKTGSHDIAEILLKWALNTIRSRGGGGGGDIQANRIGFSSLWLQVGMNVHLYM